MGIVHVGTGTVTGDEVLDASKAVTQLVQNTENFQYKFVDLSGVTELQMTGPDLQEVAAQDRLTAAFRPHAVVVIVAPRDDLFAAARRWDRLVEELGWSTHISRARSEAVRWLRENFTEAVVDF